MLTRPLRQPTLKLAILAFLFAAALAASGLLAVPSPTQASSHWTSYDTDDDNLIEITTLAQLNAIRWDLDGNGSPGSNSSAYNSAFPNRKTATPNINGCAATCIGYELMADLDFDTDGDGSTHTAGVGDSGDTYYDSGSGWSTIALGATGHNDGNNFNATLEGNGHVISNLFVNRTTGGTGTSQAVGLFGYVGHQTPASNNAVIRNVGLKDAYVAGATDVGILVGNNRGTITASWTSGTVSAQRRGGGLAGENRGTITASYSTASVTGTTTGTDNPSGGLVGKNRHDASVGTGAINYSYFAGTVSSTQAYANPLVGVSETNTTIAGSYWDTDTTGEADDADADAPEGKTTAQLQSPTAYGSTTNDIYMSWNVDVDGNTGNDDPWYFGSATDYPILKHNRHAYGINAQQSPVNYDPDDDKLISINSLAQLDAIRYDLDGNGTHNARTTNALTIANLYPGLGAGTPCAPNCLGYELTANLDFDEDGDGSTHTSGTGDSGDVTYYNSGAGWIPIGGHHKTDGAAYAGDFDGNNHTIDNLFINLASTTTSDAYFAGLFGQIAGTVRNVVLADPYVLNTRSNDSAALSDNIQVGALAGTGSGTVSGVSVNGGSVAVSQATGANLNTQNRPNVKIGCLLGNTTNVVSDSRASCNVRAAGSRVQIDYSIGGLIGQVSTASGTVSDSSAAGTVTLADTATNQQGGSNVGGLIGGMTGTTSAKATLTRSFATGAVSSNYRGQIGGLVGYFRFSNATNSYATGAVANTKTSSMASDRAEIGGLVGLGRESSITSSFATGAVTVGATTDSRAGGLVGNCLSDCDIAASFAVGAVAASGASVDAGGLVGRLSDTTSSVDSCYATGAVTATGGTGDILGGLIGVATTSPIVNGTYSTGAVTGGTGDTVGGLAGSSQSDFGTSTFNYWDVTTSGVADGATIILRAATFGTGQATSALKTPVGYTNIYTGTTVSWDRNLDGVSGTDDPWHFGTSSDYPILKYKYDGYGFDRQIALQAATAPDRIDYDANNNSLVDITTLAQLDAVRYDLDGNGQSNFDGAAALAYRAAFPNMTPLMGCPSHKCAGYELSNDLDFDTGSPGDRTDDDYYGAGTRAGHGWAPIIQGTGAAGYSAIFDGNNNTIANLYINLPAGTTTTLTRIGLFGQLDPGGVIRNVGVADASVFRAWGLGGIHAGALLGYNSGTVQASYATGSVSVSDPASSNSAAGGLVGQNNRPGVINASYAAVATSAAATEAVVSTGYAGGLVGFNYGTVNASYATGAVHATAADAATFVHAGGLVGVNAGTGGTVNASYATGTVTSSGPGSQTTGGLIGQSSGDVADSYWNTATSGLAAGAGTGAATGITGHTTAELQTPTDYSGIYENWNIDLDNADGDDDLTSGNDNPWRFGSDSQFPVLYFSRPDPSATFTDYDADNDGLIEIANLDQLNAVRYDLDGDGSASHADYAAAFPGRDPVAPNANGCIAACRGYELAANLDFDTNASGASYTTDPSTQVTTGDALDDYYNAGAGWNPIGGHQYDRVGGASSARVPRSRPFTATFDGNGRTISNLYINLTTTAAAAGYHVGLFGHNEGVIQNVGLINPYVNNDRDGGRAPADPVNSQLHMSTGALVGNNVATVRRSYVSGGSVQANQADITGNRGNFNEVGCLIGHDHYGAVSASWASCAVTATGADVGSTYTAGGLIGEIVGGELSDSWASGTVTTILPAGETSDYNGGLVGSMQQNATVTGSYATGNVTGVSAVGGLVGYTFQHPTVTESFATGTVTATGAGCNAGGLIGTLQASSTGGVNYPVSASYATGAVNVSGASCKAGGLAGITGGRISVLASFATGYVTASGATSELGGLTGTLSGPNAVVRASYATGNVTATGAAINKLGGLVGAGSPAVGNKATIIASYSTGRVTGVATDAIGGLTGDPATSFQTITASYWDTDTSTITATGSGEGKTTAELKTPTAYGGATDIYPTSSWNADLDGTTGGDDPWHFGSAADYPILQYRQDAFGIARQIPADTTKNYDSDADNLIEIDTLAQLNAIRYDLDGNGATTRAPAAARAYGAAFPGMTLNMGCPAICAGYELDASLDFDADGDGAADAPYASWTPIGAAAAPYAAAFHGNGHTISNLAITTTDNAATAVGLFGDIRGDNALITSLGLTDVSITATYNPGSGTIYTVGALAGSLATAADTAGAIRTSYATGAVTVNASGAGPIVRAGGLVGFAGAGAAIAASYSTVNVAVNSEATSTGFDVVGGLVGSLGGSVANSYATGTAAATAAETRIAPRVGGLNGTTDGTVTASYWDTATSGIADDADNDPPEGKTTAELQKPTRYTGIYAAWNETDLDNDGENDAPWDFGDACQYPVLAAAAGGHDPEPQRANDPACPAPAAGEQEYVAPPVVYNLNIRFSVRRIRLDEGQTASYRVRLSERPAGHAYNITIRSDNPDVVPTPDSLTFTGSNWNQWQTVKITIARDSNRTDEDATLAHRGPGLSYGSILVSISDTWPGANEETVNGHTVTMRHTLDAPAGVTVTVPDTLDTDTDITIGGPPADAPDGAPGYGIGQEPETRLLARISVSAAPADGLAICMPLSEALLDEAAGRPIALLRYANGVWTPVANAERRDSGEGIGAELLCAAGVAEYGIFAPAYTLPTLGRVTDLAATPGAAPGTLVLTWTPGVHATTHWLAGVKQTDPYSLAIWGPVANTGSHTLTGLAPGVPYILTITAGRGERDGSQWTPWSPWVYVSAAGAASGAE